METTLLQTKTEGTKEKTLEIGVITGERHILQWASGDAFREPQ